MYDEAGHLLGEYDVNGAVVFETVYVGDLPVAALTPSGTSTAVGFIYADHLNTARVIARSTDHAIVWQWGSSEPFGITQATTPQGSYTYDQRFPGQVADSETGWNYNWNRDYQPGLGRFSQPDPIGVLLYNDMASRQLPALATILPDLVRDLYATKPEYNPPYTYVADNPLNFTDRSGWWQDNRPPGGGGAEGGGGECRNIGMVPFPGIVSPVIRTFWTLCVYDCNLQCPSTTKEIKFRWNFSVNQPVCPASLSRSAFK